MVEEEEETSTTMTTTTMTSVVEGSVVTFRNHSLYFGYETCEQLPSPLLPLQLLASAVLSAIKATKASTMNVGGGGGGGNVDDDDDDDDDERR